MVFLGRLFINILFPDQYPLFSRWDFIPKSASLLSYERQFQSMTNSITKYASLELVDPLKKKRSVTFTSRTNSTLSRTSEWSDFFSLNYPFNDFLTDLAKEGLSLPGTQLFANENIFILTDGRCGSTCSQFVKHIKELRLARAVYFGASPVKATEPLDIGSFAAGNVIDPTELVPNLFPRAGTSMTMVMMNSYSFNWKTENDTFEFMPVAPSVSFPYFASPKLFDLEFLANLLQKDLLSLLSRCFDGEVKEDPACTTPSIAADAKAHGVYGRPCTGTSFSTNTCVFKRCANSFYLTKEGTCELIPGRTPPTDNTKSESKSLSPGAVAGIVIALIVVIVVAVIVVLVLIRFSKRYRVAREAKGPLGAALYAKV
jgi:hypothetical protein